jgi:septal ring factor EnvC (AmiA/AmiB activator)
MTDEEMQKVMDFVVNQQAQFASDIGELKDVVARLANATLGRFEATDRRLDDVDRRISALVDSQLRTEESIRKTEENISRTEDNVRALTAVVDRYFSEGRNGK